jgi:hypothetical protein
MVCTLSQRPHSRLCDGLRDPSRSPRLPRSAARSEGAGGALRAIPAREVVPLPDRPERKAEPRLHEASATSSCVSLSWSGRHEHSRGGQVDAPPG